MFSMKYKIEQVAAKETWITFEDMIVCKIKLPMSAVVDKLLNCKIESFHYWVKSLASKVVQN
jgi:hypothetical protein